MPQRTACPTAGNASLHAAATHARRDQCTAGCKGALRPCRMSVLLGLVCACATSVPLLSSPWAVEWYYAQRSSLTSMHLDVPVGDAQAVAVVHRDHELLEQRARRRLRQRLAL